MVDSQYSADATMPSTLYMTEKETYTFFVMKPVRISSVMLEQGTSAKLWLKTNSEEKVVADLWEPFPALPQNLYINFTEQLYLESNGPVLVALVGCFPEFDQSPQRPSYEGVPKGESVVRLA
ncbi:uncharacterized protein LOC111077052 [Drosophila obscura]|uniref:uncharacterized protein LOC111077052 n=1 Tax=Drosophila obscura TaxID=7282 RepID=UPI001BB1201F|nr:uncharacterized protein LOC111077052 [Drosophila obscura]